MKLRRILAWIIDWNLCGAPAIIYASIFKSITETQAVKAIYALLFVLFVLSFPTLFVVRDVLFKGRSIAKRIFKLRVIDNETNELPEKEKLVIHNLFFFIYPVEAIFRIATNKSIGDMVTNTTVVNN
jgi:uncharacterized RDD family membrane protein YckC